MAGTRSRSLDPVITRQHIQRFFSLDSAQLLVVFLVFLILLRFILPFVPFSSDLFPPPFLRRLSRSPTSRYVCQQLSPSSRSLSLPFVAAAELRHNGCITLVSFLGGGNLVDGTTAMAAQSGTETRGDTDLLKRPALQK